MTEATVIKKIRKLFNLAAPDSGATEGERENAERMAQELMHKHNLREFQIGEEQGTSLKDKVTADQEYFKRSQFWIGDLMSAIGNVHHVAVVRSGNNNQRRYTLIGTPDNIAFIRVLTDHLVPWLKQECKVGIAQSNPKNPNAFRRAFYRQATGVIHQRLLSQQRSLQSQSTDLVLAYDAANKQKLAELFGAVRQAKQRSLSDRAGIQHGHQSGMRADLSPGRKLKG